VIHTTLSLHKPYAGGGNFVASLSIPAASSSRANATGIGRGGFAKPPGPVNDIRGRSSSSGVRIATIQMVISEWQKNIVVNRMTRIRSTWNSWLSSVFDNARARSGDRLLGYCVYE
jgi:hypothetical protein